VHFIALGHPYSATSVARTFFDQIVRLHGIPCSIVSDQDPVFTSSFWTELFQLSGVQVRLSSAFLPQTDGQSEVTNRILGVYLHCLAGDRPLLISIGYPGRNSPTTRGTRQHYG
jgi:hypothetical protein